MSFIRKKYLPIVEIAIVLGVFLLPFSNSSRLINGIQTAKPFYFFYYILALACFASFRLFFKREKIKLNVTVIDIFFFAFVVWISLNKYLLQDVHAFSLRYFELLGLCILFIILRSIEKKFYELILVAICVSGLAQSIYGNLQLWGYYSSFHGLFKMTGSFFNPGPYAGFLCAVLPVAVGLYLNYRKKETGEIGSTLRNSFDATCSKLSSFTFEKFDVHNVSRLNVRKLFSQKIDSVKSESNIREVPMNIRSKRKASNDKVIKHEVSNNQTIIEENHQKRSEAKSQTRSLKRETSTLLEQLIFLIIKYITLITIITILLVLPAARSRAAWLGAIAGVAFLAWYKFNLSQYFNLRSHHSLKLFNHCLMIRNRTIVTIFALVLFAGGLCLYHYKKDSADGRMFIWAVTTNIIKDHPILGVGQDRFKAYSMNYQADYFRNHSNSKYGMVAADNQYVFNEFLNIWVENGVIGFLLMGGLVFVLFFRRKEIDSSTVGGAECSMEQQSNHTNSNNQTIEHSNNIGSNIQTPEHSNDIAPYRENLEPETLLRSSLLAILVFGMFAYPSEILSIKIVATICVGLLASMAVPLLTCNKFSFLPMVTNPLRPLGLNLSLFTIVITAFFVVTPNVNKCFTAYCKWKDAIDLYNYGMYQQCLDDYKKAYPVLKYNGGYLLNYGKALSMAQKHDEAVTILEQAKSYQSNSVLYTALGDSYKALGNYQYAEQQYLQAANMAPAKFYPLYLLAKLYDVSGQQHKALEMANILLNKEVKVHSTAIDEIKEEMTQIIEQYTKGKQP